MSSGSSLLPTAQQQLHFEALQVGGIESELLFYGVVARIALYTVPTHATREVLYMRTLLCQFNAARALLEEGAGNGPYSNRLDFGHFCGDFIQLFLSQGFRKGARSIGLLLGCEFLQWRHRGRSGDHRVLVPGKQEAPEVG